MKKKFVITLLFSLFTVAICSNLKAAEDGKSPKFAKKTGMVRARKYNALLDSLIDKQDEITNLRKLQEQLKTDQKDTTECEDDLTSCQKESENIREQLLDCGTHATNLVKELKDSQRSHQSLVAEISGFTDDNDVYHEGLQNKADRLQQAENTWKEKNNAFQKEAEETRKQFTDCSTRVISLKKKNQGLQSKADKLQQAESTWKDKNNALQTEVENKARKVTDLEDKATKNKATMTLGKTFNRCKPFIGGLALAGGAHYILDNIEGKGKYLNLLHLATNDSRKLQSISLLATFHGFHHTFLNGYSTQGIDEEGGMLIIPGRNVGAEIVSSLGLRYIWNRFIAKRMKSNNDNIVVRNARKLPKPIKTVFKPIKVFLQDIACLAIVRTGALALHGKHPFQETK